MFLHQVGTARVPPSRRSRPVRATAEECAAAVRRLRSASSRCSGESRAPSEALVGAARRSLLLGTGSFLLVIRSASLASLTRRSRSRPLCSAESTLPCLARAVSRSLFCRSCSAASVTAGSGRSRLPSPGPRASSAASCSAFRHSSSWTRSAVRRRRSSSARRFSSSSSRIFSCFSQSCCRSLSAFQRANLSLAACRSSSSSCSLLFAVLCGCVGSSGPSHSSHSLSPASPSCMAISLWRLRASAVSLRHSLTTFFFSSVRYSQRRYQLRWSSRSPVDLPGTDTVSFFNKAARWAAATDRVSSCCCPCGSASSCSAMSESIVGPMTWLQFFRKASWSRGSQPPNRPMAAILRSRVPMIALRSTSFFCLSRFLLTCCVFESLLPLCEILLCPPGDDGCVDVLLSQLSISAFTFIISRARVTSFSSIKSNSDFIDNLKEVSLLSKVSNIS
mmetsp:Transcript_27596/g.37981  ORF Transcript_27596/g.37981 Transcript_27596/m.37981 type:complete len:448 (-) Transcript_27596:413-1756(-)